MAVSDLFDDDLPIFMGPNGSTYMASVVHPFGLPNPDTPGQILAFEPMIGICQCASLQHNQDGTWQDTVDMIWKFKNLS